MCTVHVRSIMRLLSLYNLIRTIIIPFPSSPFPHLMNCRVKVRNRGRQRYGNIYWGNVGGFTNTWWYGPFLRWHGEEYYVYVISSLGKPWMQACPPPIVQVDSTCMSQDKRYAQAKCYTCYKTVHLCRYQHARRSVHVYNNIT